MYNLSLTPSVVSWVSKNINIWKSLGSAHSTLQVKADWKNVTADPEAPRKGHAFMYVECSVDFILISYSMSVRSLCHSFTGRRCFSYTFRTSSYAHFSQCLCAQREKKWFEKYFTSVMLLLSVTDYIMCFKTSFCWNVNVPLYIYLAIEP